MRSIWSGALSFGLVNIPIKLYSATGGTELNLTMLHKTDLSPIRYAKICKADGKEIPFTDIIKGYEYQKGDYVVLTDEDFKKANVRKTKSIDIVEFSDESEIDSIYFEKPYFLEPEKGAEKAYALLREALKKSKKVAIAKFVLRNREHLSAIKSEKNLLILEQLRFDSEVRKPENLNLPESTVANQKEVEIALALIEQLSSPFKVEEFKDTYTEEIEKMIDQKAKGIIPKAKGEAPVPTKVPDLMAVLRESLEREQSRTGARPN